MNKRVFALVSVTTLTGIVVMGTSLGGCKAEVVGAEPDATAPTPTSTTTATPECSKKPCIDAQPPPPPPPDACPSPEAIDATQLPWKSPTRSPGSCTQAEVDAFTSKFDTDQDLAAAKASITNTACRECIFAKDGATWAPLVENAAGEVAVLNVGGCIAIASNKDACGKAYQNWFDCRFEACAGCPDGDSTALQKCLSAASKKGAACYAAFEAVVPQCGDDQTVADAEAACDNTKYIFEAPIRAQCVGLGDADL